MNSTYPIVFMAALVIYFLLMSIHTPHEGQEIKEIWHGHVIWMNSSEVPGQSNTSVTPGPDTKTNLRTTSKEPFTVYEPATREAPVDFDKDIEEIKQQKTKELSNSQPKIDHSYDKIHALLHSVHPNACTKHKILKGDNSKEPDVHICMDNISPPCVVYSFGIANNWIFDDFMISQGCHVFSFDPSMNVGKHKRHENHLFEPIGIGSKSGRHGGPTTLINGQTNYDVLTLADMMKRYNNDHVDIIRMDTEYAEWDVLQQWFKQGMFSKIDQLLLEIHMWPRTGRANHGQVHSEILHSIPMTLFHEARNKWNNKRLAGDMTSVYEVGFITKSQSLENKKSSDVKRPVKNDVKRPVKKFQDRASYNFNDIISGYAIDSIKSLSTSTWLCDEILCEYYRNWRQKWNPKFENYTFDKYLLHRVIENHIDKYAYELPSADDIVMHIRLGDVSRTACFDYPHKCRINSGKLPYQFTGNCYEDVLERLPKTLTRIVLVSSNKWNPSDRRESDLYKIKLIRLLEEKGYEVIDRSNQYMDSDIAFVSHAKYLIGGGGGFAQTLKEQAKLNGAKQVWNAWHPWVQGQKCVWVDDSVEPKKIDIFHVNHEKAIWRMRFEEHWDFVDEFHIFESSVSHQGNPKRLYFKETQDELKKYASKIVYHEISADFNSEPCKKKGDWTCETHDRIEIAKTMNGILRDDDIVIFSDVDEIVFEDVLAKLGKQPSLLPTRIRTPVYKHSFHWKQQKSDDWKQCIVAHGAYVKKYNDWNSLRRKNDIAAIIEHGGLHLSTFGSIDEIVTKSLHSRTKRILDRDETIRRVNNGISLWDKNKQFVYEENVPILPKLAKSDPEYFEEHFMRYGDPRKPAASVRECALLFFGLAKHFNDTVFPSIQKYILNINPDCQLYVHTYDIKSITNPRNNEDHTPVNPLEVYSMTKNVVLDTLESVSKAIDFDYYHKHYKQTSGVFPYSMDNSLKQWFSIQRVWESMPSKYKRVGLFRLDVLYTEPIDIQNGDAVIPDFHHWGGINDRAFYGLYKWAKQWATARFKKLAIRSKQENIYDMHAETFVKYLMRDVPIELKPMCFKRVRATGEIKDDCTPSVLNNPPTPQKIYGKRHFGLGNNRGLTNQLWEFLNLCTITSVEYLSLEELRFRSWSEGQTVRFDQIWDVDYWNKNKPVTFPRIVNKKATHFISSHMVASFAYLAWRGIKTFDPTVWKTYKSFIASLQLKESLKSSVDKWKAQHPGPYGCIHARVEQDLNISTMHISSRIKLKPLWSIMHNSPLLSDAVKSLKILVVLNKKDLENDDLELINLDKDPWNRPLISTSSLHGNDVLINSAIDQYVCQQGELFVGCQFSSFSYQVGHMMEFRNKAVFMYGRNAIVKQITQMTDWKCLNGDCLSETPVDLNKLLPKRLTKIYHSSEWEQLWLDNIEEWQNHQICEALTEQKEQIHAFIKDTCSATTDTDWCLIDDSVHQVWYNTKDGQTTLQKPSSVTTISPLKEMTPKDDSIWSYFELPDGTREYIEPLVSHLRHPLARCMFVDTFLTDRSYVLPGNPGQAKTFLFDAGASHWSQGAGGPSLSYFASVWKRYGFDWSHIEGWEGGTTVAKFEATVPQEWRSRTHFHKDWVSTSPDKQPFVPDVIRSVASKQDYVVFKLDIDSKSVETAIVDYLLTHPEALKYIDEFVWEHHVDNYIMAPNWKKTQDMTKSIADSYQYFLKLRKLGVRAHSWV